MILVQKGTMANLVCTLSEVTEGVGDRYLFHFRHILTGEEVEVTVIYDLSSYPDRFNEFSIGEEVFRDRPLGFWTYEVWEAGAEGRMGTMPVEKGRMFLKEGEAIRSTVYRPKQTFKVYDGK